MPPARAACNSRGQPMARGPKERRDRDRDATGSSPRRGRAGREARQHQPRRQGGEGRPSLRLCRSGRGRRRQGPGRPRRRQGPRSAGGDPQGHRAGQAQHDPRAAARGPHPASRCDRPLRRRPRRVPGRRARHRHHRRRAGARHLRGPRRSRRGREVGRHLEPAQHGEGRLCGAGAAARRRAPSRPGAARR